MTDAAAFRDELDRALRTSYDRAAAVAVALHALDEGTISIPALYDVLAEILGETGSGWQAGTIEVWQEHLVTGIVRTIVEACATRIHTTKPDPGGDTVLLAAPDDEFHDLGLRMLTDRFTLAGWRAHFLGAHVPVAELVAAARSLDAHAVALSAATHFHRLRLRSYFATLTEALPDVRVWVGGPAFARSHEGWLDELVLDPRAIPPAGEGC